MNIKCSIAHSNALLAEDGHRWVILLTIHRDCQLRLVRMFFGSNLHRTVVDHDVASIESSLIARVIVMRREYQSATINLNKFQQRRFLNVHEKAKPIRHSHALTIYGCQ